MRGLGLVAVLLALLVVGWLGMRQSASLGRLPAPPAAAAAGAASDSVRAQGQRIEQQFRQQLENALQAPREVPDDAR